MLCFDYYSYIQYCHYHAIYCPESSIKATLKPCGGSNLFCPLGSSTPTTVSSGYYSIHPISTTTTAATGVQPVDYSTQTGQAICERGSYCVSGIKYICPASYYGSELGLTKSTCSGLCAPGKWVYKWI